MDNQTGLRTIWEVFDKRWAQIEPVLAEADPPKLRGRKRANPRKVLTG